MSASNAGRIGVFGASGSGKSSYVKQLTADRGRVVYFDPLDEYQSLCKVKVTSPAQLKEAMKANWSDFRIAYVPASGSEARHLSAVCRCLTFAQEPYRQSEGKGRSGLTLVVEEMNLSFHVQNGESKAPGMADMCSRGRHYGIELIGVSQRIAEVSTRFRGNCTETVIFRQQGPRDVQAAANELDGDRTSVTALHELEYLRQSKGRIDRGTVKFDKRKSSRGRS